jgi:phosphate/phosphite/phosphonate ABC transporter binding protein
MSGVRKLVALVCALLVVGFATNAMAADEIKFGVQSSRGALKTIKKWGELAKYLEKKTGKKVTIVPLKPGKTEKAVKSGKVDFMLSNPVVAVSLIKKQSYKPLATLKKKSGPKFGGVIFTKKGNGIQEAHHLKGRNVMAYKFKRSAAAYVFQVKHLKDKGIDAHKDFKSFREAKKQDDIVLAVKAGIVDAGFVKTGLLEAMEKEGKVKLSEFHVIDRASDDFQHVHSTKLYPLWTLTVSPKYDSAVADKVKAALLALKADHVACKKGKFKGFVDAVSLDGLKETLKSLNLPPFS